MCRDHQQHRQQGHAVLAAANAVFADEPAVVAMDQPDADRDDHRQTAGGPTHPAIQQQQAAGTEFVHADCQYPRLPVREALDAGPAKQMQTQYLPQIQQQARSLDMGQVMNLVRGR